jgi:SAM-dependent methyltransferase
MLDIGGNSGEFALQVCRRHTAMRASVLDLPLVCDIGREHVAGASEAERIDFIRGDALAGPLPGGFDLISFKSMLHDWPEKEASLLVAKASRALEPGGTLLIFERGRAAGLVQTDYCAVPMLLFFRYFRDAEFYERLLSGLGLVDVLTREIRLDVPFCLITAKKGAEGR